MLRHGKSFIITMSYLRLISVGDAAVVFGCCDLGKGYCVMNSDKMTVVH